MRAVFVMFVLLVTVSPAVAEDGQKKLSVEMKRSLQAALDKISTEGQADMLQDQKQWNDFLLKYCSKANLGGKYKTADDCLLQKTKERASSLGDAVNAGTEGLVIRRRESFHAYDIEVEDADGQKVTQSVPVYDSWPQIDNPTTNAQRDWNKLMATNHPYVRNEVEGHDCEYSQSYEVQLRGADFISVGIEDWTYCYGTPHGFGGSTSKNYILSARREIAPSDIFVDGTAWEDALGKLAVKSLAEQDKTEVDTVKITKHVAKGFGWGFSSKGMVINFGRINGHAGGEYVATIPWAELKPYMIKDSPLAFVFQ